VKSNKIRKSAKGESCALRQFGCRNETETVVFCHLNSPYKGLGLKSPDIFGVYGCFHCHRLLDSYKVSTEDQMRALMETQMKLVKKGLITVVS